MKKKWLPNLKPFFDKNNSHNTFTSKELNWLIDLPELKLGINLSWEHFDFVDDKGQHSGLSADYMSHLVENLPITVEAQKSMTWNQAFEEFKLGKIDLMSGIVKTKEREKWMDFTVPYISFPSVIATSNSSTEISNMKNLQGKRVGVEKGMIFEEIYRSKHPEINLVVFNNIYDGLRSLQAGKIDAFIDTLSSVNQAIIDYQLSNISIAGFTPYKFELSIGVRKGLEPLVPIFDRTLLALTDKQKYLINNNWLRNRVETNNLSSLLIWIIPIVFVLFTIMIFIILANKRLEHEIFHRKKIEKNLELAKQKADKANQAKDNFLAHMSYEIKTPMNGVVGMSELMSETSLNKTQVTYNNAIRQSADSLLIIINDILDLSKIEAGKMELESRSFDLKRLLKRTHSQGLNLVAKKEISLNINIQKNIPQFITGDEVRLGQILLNRLNNAIKFTQQGSVKLLVQAIEPKDSLIGFQFCITDTGKELTTEEQKKLFKNYGQADSSTTRKYGGTGLGLTISAKLCELMQGEIWFTSKEVIGRR